jgi:diguanylate cyclase (GGDEF)-like protein/PAS domain S-box-containing protein
MVTTFGFLKKVTDSLSEHIVVVDQEGTIVFVNRAWLTFGLDNDCRVRGNWIGVNYIEACEKADQAGDEYGGKAATGTRQVINREASHFYLEYPCHSPTETRWFMMRVIPFEHQGKSYCVLSHQNITERKNAEEKVLGLSRLDGLTNLANRRYFDEFYKDEWRRCVRLRAPITIAMVDIDHFKLYNDTYGHLAGDQCLIKISQALKALAKRPTDFCARFGGEEFILVFGQSTAEQIQCLLEELFVKIRDLKISNSASPTDAYITVSVGVASTIPDTENEAMALVDVADHHLYLAKSRGRNRVVYSAEVSGVSENVLIAS